MKQIRCVVKAVPDSVEVVLNTIKPDSFMVVVHHRSINWLVPK